MNFKQDLNDQQYEVVTNGDGYCLVLAGAGSGKTRTVTYRVAYLLEQGVGLDQILLVTFTNKAANEMIERVAELTGSTVELPWAGTFHSIGNKILRRHADRLDYDKNFSILDMEDSKKMIKKCMEQIGINRKEERFPSAKVLQSIISFARNSQTTIENVLDMKHPKFFEHLETIKHLTNEYDRRKRASNAMDFDDLLVNFHRLLVSERDIKDKYSQQFKYVLADEYQDTNKLQASILEEISEYHENLLVVGDDAQSIYSFRAAEIENILEFEQNHPDARKFKLETNYRSTPEILNVANEIIKNNPNQHEKELESIKDEFDSPETKELSDQKGEARFIVKKMNNLHNDGVPYSEMATLFRASYHSQALEVELAKNGIPYEFRGGMRFFERAHIKDVLAYLRILNNPEDNMAWDRVLNLQTGIGAKTSQKIINRINSLDSLENISSVGSGLNSRAQKGWTDFLSVWEDMQKVEDKTPSKLIDSISKSDYADYLENEYANYKERLKDIEQLSHSAKTKDYEDEGSKLHDFLAEASLQEKYETKKKEKDKVVLSTIHQAKGLEWKTVFIMNLAEGQFPNDRAVKDPSGLEEERRLFYVAVTRAKKHLYLTYPLTGIGSRRSFQQPSQFIDEISHLLAAEEENKEEILGGVTYEYDDSENSGFLSDIDEL